jgi:hypothetical protein
VSNKGCPPRLADEDWLAEGASLRLVATEVCAEDLPDTRMPSANTAAPAKAANRRMVKVTMAAAPRPHGFLKCF